MNFKEGYIFKLKSKDVWIYEYLLNGKQKRIQAKRKKDLLVRIEKLHEKLYKGLYVVTNKTTIPHLLHKANNKKLEMNQIQDSTYGRNKHTISIIEKSNLGDMPIQDIKIEDIDRFSKTITRYSNSTIQKVFIMLGNAYKEAIKHKIVIDNIVEDYKKPISIKKDKQVIAFTLEEHQKLLKVIDKSIYYMQYLIALNTGMRMGEVNALHIEDVDFENKKINITKTISRDSNYKDFINNTTKTKNGVRSIDINSILYSPFKKFCKDKTGYLFSEDRIISTGMVNCEFKRLCAKYNIKNGKVNTHMLRHTYATRAIESGMQAVVLKKILGHADISTTLNTYSHVFEELENESTNKLEEYLKKLY